MSDRKLGEKKTDTGREEKKREYLTKSRIWAELKRIARFNNVSIKSRWSTPGGEMRTELKTMRKKYGSMPADTISKQEDDKILLDRRVLNGLIDIGYLDERYRSDKLLQEIRLGRAGRAKAKALKIIAGRRKMFFVSINPFMAVPYVPWHDKITFDGRDDEDKKKIELTSLTFKLYEDPRKSASAMKKIYDHIAELFHVNSNEYNYGRHLITKVLLGQLIQARGFPDDDMKRLYDKRKSWRKNITIGTVIPITASVSRSRVFDGVVLKAEKPIEFSSLGTNSENTWNKSIDQCAINALLSELRGTNKFKTLTRQSIYQDMDIKEGGDITVNDLKKWLTKRKVPCYLLDSTNKVVWKSDFKTNETQHKTIFLKIDNDHLYPIQDEILKGEIVRNGEITKCEIDYSSGFKVVDLSIQTIDDCVDGVNIIQNHSPDHKKGVHNNLTALCLDFIKNQNIVPENVVCSSQNQVIQFSIGEKWFVHKKDYTTVIQCLEATLKIPEMKERATLFAYRGQPIQTITKDLLRATNMTVPVSEFCSQTMDIYLDIKSGAYNGGVYHENKNICNESLRSLDVRRCHTSIAYNRKHRWGVFRPWNEWVNIPAQFKVVEGAMFIIENVDMGHGLKLGSNVFDSQFVEYALTNGLIKLNQIKKMLNPFFTIPANQFKKTIDLIYENYNDKIAKDMVNLYIGCLGSTGASKKIVDSSFTTSKVLAHEWMTRGEEYKSEPVGDSFLNYREIDNKSKTLSNNVMMYQSIVSTGFTLLHKLTEYAMTSGLVKKIWTYRSDSITVEMKDPDMEFTTTNADGSRVFMAGENSNRWGLGAVRKEKPQRVDPIWIDLCNDEKIKISPKFSKFKNSDIVDVSGCIVVGRAGRGKSWNLMNKIIPQLDDDYLIVSLTHKALENLNGIPKERKRTLASLFMDKGESQKTMLSRIASSVSTIILEEYTMCGQKDLIKLYKLHQLGVSIILIGDHHQIPAIDNRPIRAIDYSFIKEMCPTLIELTGNHRFDQELDDLSMRVYNEGIFEPTLEMILKPDEKTRLNICYYIKTKYDINKQFSDSNKLINTTRVKTKDGHFAISGSPVICSEKLEGSLVNGTMCDIVNINEESVTIKSDKEYTIKTKVFTKNFNLGHCGTVHCFQGSTIKGDLTIHDMGSMTRQLLYTATTRPEGIQHIKVKEARVVKDIRHTKYYNMLDEAVLITKDKKDIKKGYVFMDITTNAFGYSTVKPKDGILATVQFHDEMELRTEAQFMLNDLINSGVEVGETQQFLYKKNPPKRLVARQYKEVKTSKLPGCILTEKDAIVLQWSVNGKRTKKKWRVTKKRTLEQAMELAKEHQIKLSQ